jgi:hypothetical protein
LLANLGFAILALTFFRFRGEVPAMNQVLAQKRATAHGRRGQDCRLLVEPLEGRLLLSAGPWASSLRPPIDGPFLVSPLPSALHSSQVELPGQPLGGNPFHRDTFSPQREFVGAEASTQTSLLLGNDLRNSEPQLSAPATPTEILPRYTNLTGNFEMGARHGTVALDAVFANLGASHDFLSGGAIRLYESNPHTAWVSSSDGIPNADEGLPYSRVLFLVRVMMDPTAEETLSVSSRSPSEVRTAAVSDVQDVLALGTGALPTGNSEGRAIGVVSRNDLRMPAFPGPNRGWVDSTQGFANFTVPGLSLGSSPGQTVGVLAWSDSPSAVSVWTATPDLDPEDVVTTAEFEVDDAASIPVSVDGVRTEWPAPVPQVASLLTEGVTVGVTAIERAVLTLAEPILDAGDAPHEVLYWLGVTSWVVAAALAGETLRRRYPQFQTSVPSLFGGPPDPLG